MGVTTRNREEQLQRTELQACSWKIGEIVNIAVMARGANLLCLILVSLTAFSLVLAEEASEVEGEEAELPEESFTSTKEFKAIMGGVAGFWGGVFALGAVYLFAVFAKRMYNPEEAVVKGED